MPLARIWFLTNISSIYFIQNKDLDLTTLIINNSIFLQCLTETNEKNKNKRADIPLQTICYIQVYPRYDTLLGENG